MHLDEEFVSAVQDLAKTEVVKVNEVDFTTKPVHDTRTADPVAKALEISTLTGIIDYLSKNVDQADKAKLMLHIVAHNKVSLISNLVGRFRQREVLLKAEIESLFGQSFQFGAYYDLETFIIALQILFIDSPERAKVLSIVGNIRDESVQMLDDDGTTQTVTARAGIAIRSDVAVPNPVMLQPWRTFRELEQPQSPFVLRLKQNKDAKPSCGLFEADGGAWKLVSIGLIRTWLETEIKDVAIIG